MSSLLRSFITQLFISIIVDKDQIFLCAKSYKKKEVIDSFERSFEDVKKLNKYLQELTLNYQIYYVGLFMTSLGQGLVPVNNPRLVGKYEIDYYSITCVILKNYLIYIHTKELERTMSTFSKIIPPSSLYSPFALLDYLINAQPSSKLTLSAYKYSSYLAVAIFRDGEAKFGAYFHILLDSETDLDDDNFEEISIPDEDEDDDDEILTQKLDLKSLDEMMEDNEADDEEDDDEGDLKDFTHDMKMCEYIVAAVKEYYENELYESEFIEDILLFSEDKIQKAAMQFLESELFLRPKQELINTMEIMQTMMVSELA